MSSTHSRRSSFSLSTTSSLAKRHASENSGSAGKVTAQAKKRAPLGNITNRTNVSLSASSKINVPNSSLVPCTNKVAKAKKVGPSIPASFSASSSAKTKAIFQPKAACSVPRRSEAVHVPCNMDVSPTKSDNVSVSMDESMSTSCDSFKSPEVVEYVDNSDVVVPVVSSITRKTFNNLYISDTSETTGNACGRDVHVEMETDDKIVDVDNDFMDPQLCATIACDIYQHLRASEVKKRPSTDFMEKTQKDINASMRSILIDWLVEVAEEYRLIPDTLYLTVNYIDRYLSGNPMNRQRLQLLGVACMMIASKYEEICAPQVEEFCYITDNTYFKDEVLEMESAVLNFLKFEMTAPTSKCFLRRFVRVAQGNEAPSMQLECLANYVAELSLLEYNMLSYAPSLIAASAIFLANFILVPSKRPWNSTLQHYTQYQPSDLSSCVKELHRLCSNNHNSSLPAIREKYSQHKYKYVAKKYVPPMIPSEFFH